MAKAAVVLLLLTQWRPSVGANVMF